jgi:hypothetical protein
VALLALACAPTSPAQAAKQPRFASKELPINSQRLDDLSVADIDGDGDMDMFSAHHRYRGNLLINENGNLLARYDRSGLSSTANVPGFDDQFNAPEIVPAGLYIWVDDAGRTHIVTKDLERIPQLLLDRATGNLRFQGRGFQIEKQVGARLAVRNDPTTNPPSKILDFDAGPNSEVVLRAQFMDLPFNITTDALFPRQRVFLGPRRTSPRSFSTEIRYGDRHGVSWADFNQDGAMDLYITHGGVRGGIKVLSDFTRDEMYFADGDGTFTQDIESTGIDKGLCRGRYSAPVDFDLDGDLDLFGGCEGGRPILFRQRQPGKFGSASELLQTAGVRGDFFRWIDLDRNRSPELVAADGQVVSVYQRDTQTGAYSRIQRLRPPGLGKSLRAITLGDADGDLDVDIFVSSVGGNAYLENRGGKLFPRRPGRIGLPPRRTAALSFVDYDNDGNVDAHAAPGGLFVGDGKGHFERTDQLSVAGAATWATLSWFDLEGDGDRDLVSLIKRSGATLRKRVFENQTRGGNWLQLTLDGARANAQAIGARVVVTTSEGRQAGWVGQSEGSRFSSGHYDLYFGLGRAEEVRTIRVWWPDGTQSSLSNVAVNRHIDVEHPG